MSSNEVSKSLSLKRGTQVLLSLPSMESPFGYLPAGASRDLVVISSEPPATVADRLESAGVELDAVAHVPISGSETAYEGPMWTCDPLVPDDLTGLSMRLSRAFEYLAGGYLLMENLNVFLMYAAEERVVRFLDYLTGLAEDHGITGIYTLDRDSVAGETYDRLRLNFDTELDRC